MVSGVEQGGSQRVSWRDLGRRPIFEDLSTLGRFNLIFLLEHLFEPFFHLMVSIIFEHTMW